MLASVKFRRSVAALYVMSTACGGGNLASNLAKGPEFQPRGGDSKCGVTKSQAKPLIVEWSPSDRGELESKVHRGIVAVHYEGCEMEVLERCHLSGSYTYQGITPKHDSVTMKDADELYATIPFGAAKYESTLNRSGALKVAMTIVGRYEADVDEVRPENLKGDCSRATHVVTALTTGAFDFYAEGEATVGAKVDTFLGDAGPRGGGGSESKREMLTDDGDESACKKATGSDKTPPDGCGALIRIEVVAIGRAAEPTCPEGSKWDGKSCVRTNVVTEVQCPGGTRWDGARCAAQVSTDCAGGLHFEAGQGCVPNAVVVVPSQSTSAPGVEGAMVSIPAGTFQMGSNDGDSDEKPVHSVNVRAFRMDRTEVTTAAYEGCVRVGRCSAADTGDYCNSGKTDRGNHPINCVDWTQASTYCGWVNKRLPTEEEWEYAARGTEGRKYPWGSTEPGNQLCWKRWDANSNTGSGTCAVGSFRAGDSPFGVADMAGNVWEWTSNGYSGDYSKNRTDAARVRRGGGWGDDDASVVRSSVRSRRAPSNRNSNLGFRCAR
jgi:formylglycine-generating enzyme required for sulfatase activity